MLQTLKNFLKDVADAIREKTGKTDKIATKDMAAQVLTIQTEMPSKWGEFYHSQDEAGNYNGISFWGKAPAGRMYGPASSYITEVKFLDGITEIPISFAKSNTTLKKVTIEGDITEIKDSAFQECSNIESISYLDGSENHIPENVTAIPSYCFQNCKKLNLTLHDGIKTIDKYAFYRDSIGRNIMDDELPASLTQIIEYAFYMQQIPFTKIPANVTSIGGYAFYGNDKLTSVTFEGKPNLILNSAFAACNSLKDIYVPWAEGEVNYAPWGAINATVHYNYKA